MRRVARKRQNKSSKSNKKINENLTNIKQETKGSKNYVSAYKNV